MDLAETLAPAGWLLVVMEFGLASLAALLASGSRTRRSLAVLLVLVAAVLPLGLRAWPFPCFLAGLFGVLFTLRIVDLARSRGRMGPGERLLFMLIYFDIRTRRRVEPSFDAARFVQGLAWSGLAASGFVLVYLAAPAADPGGGALHYGIRWGGGLLAVYGTFEAADHILGVPALLLGWRCSLVQDAPIRSASVGEFWGRRWNRVVNGWLRRHCFTPLARRRHPRVGLAVSFVVSAGVHFWAVFVPAGLRHVWPMTLFFLVHGLVTLLETPLRQRTWPRWMRHGWTVVWLVTTSPLFLEPLLSTFAGT